MFSSLTGGKKSPQRRLLTRSPGADDADADKSSSSTAAAAASTGGASGTAASSSTSRPVNPFAATGGAAARSPSDLTDARPASDSGVRSGSPLRGSLGGSFGRFDPRQLWAGGSASASKEGSEQQQTTAAGSSSSAAAAAGSRRLLSSSDVAATQQQPSAAATALSSATAATPFSSATAAAPLAGLGGPSSFSQRGGGSSSLFPPRSSSRQEQIATLPSEEIEEAWNALDSEKGKGGGSANPSPEPMRWKRDSDASASAALAAGAQRSGSSIGRGPAAGPSGRYSGSGLQSDWAAASPAAAGGTDSGAAAGNTGGSTGSSPRGSSLKDRAKLVREYVKLRSTNTTPQGSVRGDSYASGRVSAGSEGGAGGYGGLLGAPSSSGGGATGATATAAGLGAGAATAGVGPSLWRLRSTSPSEPGTQGSSLQPSPLMGGSLQPSPLLGRSSSSGAGALGSRLGSPSLGMRAPDSSLPPSPVMPESPTAGGDLGGYPGATTGRLSLLAAAESRLRRKPTSASGSAASSPRAPVGIAQTEFRRRGSTTSALGDDEIEAADAAAKASTSGGVGAGLSSLRAASSSQHNRSLNYREPSAAAGPASGDGGGGGAALTAAGAGSSTAGAASAAAGSAARIGSMTASKAGTGAVAAGAAGAAGAAAVAGRPGFLGSLFGIKKKQEADVEAPPSPKRQPAAAATFGASPGQSIRTVKQQQPQVQQDTAPVYDHYSSSYSQSGSVVRNGERDQFGGARPSYSQPAPVPPPPRVQQPQQQQRVKNPFASSSSKPLKDRHINYKRLLYALLLMLALAGVAVAIWAGVTFGRKSGGGAPAAAPRPTNFTMNLAAGSKGSNGQPENCTDWFSNPTGVAKFRQTVAEAYSKALNLPASAIKVGDVGCRPGASQGRHLLSGRDVGPVNHITTSISVDMPLSGGSGQPPDGLVDSITRKIAAFFRSGGRAGGASVSSSSSSASSASASGNLAQQQRQPPAASNRTSTRLLLQDGPGSNAISTGITVDVPGDPAAQAEIIKKIESSSGDILSQPLSDLLGVPVAVEEVRHVGEQQLPLPPPPPPPSPPPPSPPPPPPPPRPAFPPPPARPWRPPVGELPPTPANIVIIPGSPKPRRRRRRSPSPSPLPSDIPPPGLLDPTLGVVGVSPEPIPSPAPKRSPRPRRSPSPSPAVAEPVVLPLPVPVPPPAPSPAVVEPAPSPVLPEEVLPASPSPKPRRRRRRSPSPAPVNPDLVLLPYPSPSPVPAAPPRAPLPTPLEPQPLSPQQPQLIADQQPGGGLPSDGASVLLPSSPSPEQQQLPTPAPAPAEVMPAPSPIIFPGEPFATAPTCSKAPTTLNSVADSFGRLWGWDQGQSCVFRPAAVSTSQPVSYSATTWQAAPSCWGVPTPQTSVLDDVGRLWGWQSGASCAYRNIPPLRGTSPPQQIEWDAAPTCMFAPTQQNSVPDTKGRLWGFQNSASCAFRG